MPNESPHIQFDDINVDVANFNAQATRFLQSGEGLESQLSRGRELLDEAFKIERRLTDWKFNLPTSWRATEVSGRNCVSRSIQEAGLYQDHCYAYSCLAVSNTWNKYRMANMRIQFAISNLLSQFPLLSTEVNEISIRRQQIQQEADNICACIPYHLGDRTMPGNVGDMNVDYPHPNGVPTPPSHYLHATAIGGFQLVNPLTTLLSMKVDLRDGQREWVYHQMMRLFKIYNVKAAL